MITVTRLEDLGHFRNDWLEARYHFSFSGYLVPARGRIEINGWEAPERAGVQVTDEEQIVIKALTSAEVVLVGVA